jgi:cyanophycinase
MIPKGKLLIIGGAEDKGGKDTPAMEEENGEFEHFEILKELIPKNKKGRHIEVITTASELPDEMKATYKTVLKKIGYTNIGFLHFNERAEVYDSEYEERVKKAACVFFTGGDQMRISTIIGGTHLHEILLEKYMNEKEFVIAGTSAGAMVIPGIMVTEGSVKEGLIDKDLKTSAGLGFVKCCIVDTHFIKRGRFGRLAHAVIINPGQLGIGLGEDTAMLIRNGREAECRGSGMVVIIDGTHIGKSNIAEVGSDDPVYVENLKIHLLVKGCRFNLDTHEFYAAEEKRKNAA